MKKAKGPFVSVVIPAHNDATRLPLTLIDVDRHLKEQDYSYEIIVVDDGSVDETAEIVKRFAPLISRFKYVNNPAYMGRGAAIRIGMFAAKGEWRVLMDAGNRTSIVEFTKMLPYIRKNEYDMVIGSRMLRGASMRPRPPVGKWMGEKIINIFARLLFGVSIRDSLAQFKCIRREAAEKIFSNTKVNKWASDVEVAALAGRLGLRIREVPIFVSYKYKPELLWRHYLQMCGELFKIRWWFARGHYKLR